MRNPPSSSPPPRRSPRSSLREKFPSGLTRKHPKGVSEDLLERLRAQMAAYRIKEYLHQCPDSREECAAWMAHPAWCFRLRHAPDDESWLSSIEAHRHGEGWLYNEPRDPRKVLIYPMIWSVLPKEVRWHSFTGYRDRSLSVSLTWKKRSPTLCVIQTSKRLHVCWLWIFGELAGDEAVIVEEQAPDSHVEHHRVWVRRRGSRAFLDRIDSGLADFGPWREVAMMSVAERAVLHRIDYAPLPARANVEAARKLISEIELPDAGVRIALNTPGAIDIVNALQARLDHWMRPDAFATEDAAIRRAWRRGQMAALALFDPMSEGSFDTHATHARHAWSRRATPAG